MQVQFDDQQWNRPAPQQAHNDKGIIGLLIKTGVVKNRQQANLAMIGLIILLCFISYFAIFSTHRHPAPPPTSANMPAQGTPAP